MQIPLSKASPMLLKQRGFASRCLVVVGDSPGDVMPSAHEQVHQDVFTEYLQALRVQGPTQIIGF